MGDMGEAYIVMSVFKWKYKTVPSPIIRLVSK